MEVSIMGTVYTLLEEAEDQDHSLLGIDGFCDYDLKKIVVADLSAQMSPEAWRSHRARTIRHEIIHAYLFESGLGANACYAPVDGDIHPETMVDWFAFQWRKLLKTFSDLGVA